MSFNVRLFFLTGIHSMQGWTATSWRRVTKKKEHKKMKEDRKYRNLLAVGKPTVKRCLLILDLKSFRL